MDDFVASGFGSQSTDQALASVNLKPLWHLIPLRRPKRPRPHPRQTLHSLCLEKISGSFHLYTPALLSTLPPILVERILHRARADRGYDLDDDGSAQRNPDITTLWAFSTLLDPGGSSTPKNHTLALPPLNTLHNFQPNPNPNNQHPFIALPHLFRTLNPESCYSFLTTLTLDGLNDTINDNNILNLRYCTHLTVLWTRGCKITDMAVRLLASALDLQERKGLCRLRAWYMPGCRGVSDRSMRALARWPGLCLLDLRGTSVTEEGMGIFNRYSRGYFDGRNADMQGVTAGLWGLFELDGAGGGGDGLEGDVLESLCLTLLADERKRGKTSSRSAEEGEDDGRWWIALHLLPTTHDLDPEWLPDAHKLGARKVNTSAGESGSGPGSAEGGGVYRPGQGMIYGQGAKRIFSEVSTYRSNLKIALRAQAEDEGLARREITLPKWDRDKESYAKYNARIDRIHDKAIRDKEKVWKEKAKVERARVRQETKVRKEGEKAWKVAVREAKKRGEVLVGPWEGTWKDQDESEKSRAFVVGNGRNARSGGAGRGKGDERDEDEARAGELMFVRMVAPDWEDLRWSNASTAMAEEQLAGSSQIRTANRTTTNVDLVADIMGTQKPARPPQRTSRPTPHPLFGSSPIQSPLPPSSRPMSSQGRSSNPPSSPTYTQLPPSSQSPPASQPKPSSNPFKSRATPSQNGVRPLGASQSSFAKSSNRSPFSSGTLKQSKLGNGAATTTATTTRGLGEDFDFSVGKKRRFEGKVEGEGSRRGMKMFSGRKK